MVPISDAVLGVIEDLAPEGYRRHRLTTNLYQPPPDEVIHLDITEASPEVNARRTFEALCDRGFRPPTGCPRLPTPADSSARSRAE